VEWSGVECVCDLDTVLGHLLSAVWFSSLHLWVMQVASGASFADCIENVDIGGPGMLRAAAKNHATVAAVTDPSQYDVVMDNMTRHGGSTDLALRRMLAAEAFQLSAVGAVWVGAA
jgi:phosphoribosylaminoimidazolecarboxamide formyltransferase/IMP cyclohydrolase